MTRHNLMMAIVTEINFRHFVIVWNQFQGQTTPKVHLRICDWLQAARDRGDERLLLLAFRACGKSTIVGLFCAWVLTQAPDTRILVVSADDALASRMVRNVRRIIERHPLTGHLIPRDPDQWASDRFTVVRGSELRDPSMIARGVTTNMTGLRADLIVCDDVEVPNTSDTADKRAELRDRLSELEYVRTPAAQTIFVGTPHAFDTIYTTTPRDDIPGHDPFLHDYRLLRLPILDDNGDSLWPDRYPHAKIDDMRKRSGPARFASQMMLQPMAQAHVRFNPALLQIYDDDLVYSPELQHLFIGATRMASGSAWWDPAFGKNGDGSVVASVFTDVHGHIWIHDVHYLQIDDQSSQDEATQQCAAVAARMKMWRMPVLGVETNGLGRFLPTILRNEIVRARTATPVIEMANTVAKTTRIMQAFDAPLAARMIHVHRSVMKTPFADEFRAFRGDGGGHSHDDGIDAVAGAILMEPVRIPSLNGGIRRQSWRGGDVFHAKTIF